MSDYRWSFLPRRMQSSGWRSRSRAASAPACFPPAGGERPGRRSVTRFLKRPVTRLSRSDMMRSDGSFLQNSSLPLIHPYQSVNPSSHSVPLKTAPHIGADQSSKQGGANKRPSCVGSNFPDWMSVRNVCVAAGRKVGHRLKDHCLAHIRPLFYFYEILSERYDGLHSANSLFAFHAHWSD